MYEIFEAFLGGKGLDLVRAEESLTHDYCRELRNADYVDSAETNTMLSRRGSKHCVSQSAGLGLGRYYYGDTDTGETKQEVITVGASAYRVDTGSFAITYSGSEPGVTVSHSVSDGSYVFTIIEGSVGTVLTYDCGIGFDEASVKTLANLKTVIDALPNFSVVITGDSSQPAAFLPPLFNSDELTIPFSYPTQLRQPSNATNPFAALNTNRNDVEFEPASFANLNNVLYVASGFDELQKYDGNKIYRAGLPQGVIDSATPVTGAATLTGTYNYLIHYRYTDAQGNVLEGAEGLELSVSPSSQDVDITFQTIADTTGFDTDMATVNGLQAGVTTITVGSGHSLEAGDTVYLLDTSTSSSVAVRRLVTATTSTTVTIDGAAVDVANGSFISCVSACLYRTKGQALYYELAVLPIDTSSSTMTYRDAISDANLGAEYAEQPYQHFLPPKGKYLTTQTSRLVISGVFSNPNSVYWSLSAFGKEGFPTENEETVQGTGGRIRGIYAFNQNIFVGRDRAIHLITGSLSDFQYVEDYLSTNLGLLSHHTIQEISGTEAYPDAILFLSQRGVYGLDRGNNLIEVSKLIRPLFQSEYQNQSFLYKRAISALDAKRFKYYLYLPVQVNSGTEDYHTSDSVVYVFDYLRGAWLGPWTGLNFGGGASFEDDELYFVERRVDSNTSNARYDLQEFTFRSDNYNQADHVSSIPFVCKPGWIWVSSIETLHQFQHMKLFSSDPNRETDFTINVQVERNFIPDVKHGSVLQLSFNAGSGSGFGYGSFGAGAFGDPTSPTAKAKLPRMKCNSMRLVFTHDTLYELVILSKILIEYSSISQEIRE